MKNNYYGVLHIIGLTYPFGLPFEEGPPPVPITAIVLGAFKGRTLRVFFKRTVEAEPIWRIKL